MKARKTEKIVRQRDSAAARQKKKIALKYGEKAVSEAKLELWDNPSPQRDYEIHMEFPEFTCLCPRSGYPDFATISIRYVPDKKIVELKSIKLYLNSFRCSYISHEKVVNTIYEELECKLKPRRLEVAGDFNPRGNLKTVIRVASPEK
ncbi:MAG: preQ(1) synthase [Nitrospiraceae bacterium]|nr:preQ(1) synthase [Nitrospiraceae bacterium]